MQKIFSSQTGFKNKEINCHACRTFHTSRSSLDGHDLSLANLGKRRGDFLRGTLNTMNLIRVPHLSACESAVCRRASARLHISCAFNGSLLAIRQTSQNYTDVSCSPCFNTLTHRNAGYKSYMSQELSTCIKFRHRFFQIIFANTSLHIVAIALGFNNQYNVKAKTNFALKLKLIF